MYVASTATCRTAMGRQQVAHPHRGDLNRRIAVQSVYQQRAPCASIGSVVFVQYSAWRRPRCRRPCCPGLAAAPSPDRPRTGTFINALLRARAVRC